MSSAQIEKYLDEFKKNRERKPQIIDPQCRLRMNKPDALNEHKLQGVSRKSDLARRSTYMYEFILNRQCIQLRWCISYKPVANIVFKTTQLLKIDYISIMYAE